MSGKKRQSKDKPYNMIPQDAHYWLCCTKDLTPKEKELMNFIFYRTYGFHRKSTRMSSRFVEVHLGINRSNVNRLFISLADKGFVDVSLVHQTRVVTLCERRYKLKAKQYDDYETEVMVTSPPSTEVMVTSPRGHGDLRTEVMVTPRKEDNTIKENNPDVWDELLAFAEENQDALKPDLPYQEKREQFVRFLETIGLGKAVVEEDPAYSNDPGHHFEPDQPWNDEVF